MANRRRSRGLPGVAALTLALTLALALPQLVACVVPEGVAPDAAPDPAACEPVSADDTFTGRNGWTLTIVMTNPSPPARASNWWAVQLDDPDGAPMIDAAAVVVSSSMPEDGHSSPTTPTITSEVDGLVVGPLELETEGRWEVRFDVESERIVVPVCIGE